MSSNHFFLGAINKITQRYEYPKIACKKNNYICPCCKNDVIFRQGTIKRPHFAHHKSNNQCTYYIKPNETQMHKDAKMLMKTLIDNKQSLDIYKKCNRCNTQIKIKQICNTDYTDNTHGIIEYKFEYNNSKKSADVALLQNNNLKYIFEICYRHKTKEENRPEPWFEIDAENFINNTNICNYEYIAIECIRPYVCNSCNIKLKSLSDKNNRLKERELMYKEDYRTHVKLNIIKNVSKERELMYKEDHRTHLILKIESDIRDYELRIR